MPRIRNFSEKKETEFLACSNSAMTLDGIEWRYAEDLDKLFQSLYKNGLCRWAIKNMFGVDTYNQIMYDSAHMTEDAIKKIFSAARKFDANKANSFNTNALLIEYNKTINEFADLINPKSPNFNIDNIAIDSSKVINNFQNEIDSYFENELNNAKLDNSCLNYDTIKNYVIDSPNNSTVYDDDAKYIENQIDSVKDEYDSDWKWVYAKYNSSKDDVLSLNFMSDNALMEVIADTVENEIKDKHSVIDASKLRHYLKLLKNTNPEKYMESDAYKNLIALYPEVSQLFSVTKGIDDLAKWIQQGSDEFVYLITDYSYHIYLLNSYKKSYAGNKKIAKAIDTLISRYNNKVMGSMQDLLSKGVEYGISELKKYAIKAIPIVPLQILITATEVVADTTMDATGMQSVYDNYKNAVYSMTLYKAARKNYLNSVKKIKSGKYTMVDLSYTENQFNAMKSSLLQSYRHLLNATDDASERCEIYSRIKRVEKMTMKNGFPQYSVPTKRI